jgi:hypothetical protein
MAASISATLALMPRGPVTLFHEPVQDVGDGADDVTLRQLFDSRVANLQFLFQNQKLLNHLT